MWILFRETSASRSAETRLFITFIVISLLASARICSAGEAGLGAFGPQGPRMREQLWLLRGSDAHYPLRATVFRPPADEFAGPRPLVVINHGTSESTRQSVSLPVYYWLSRWFVERGYVVALPQRRGHGATGGPLAEAVGTCADPDHAASGRIAAGDVAEAIRYLEQQDFVARGQTVVVGISTGGWASLALASQSPGLVRAVVNFAGGRGGHAGGYANAVCHADRLVEAAHDYGRTASSVPTLWLYAQNDSYFGPDLAKQMSRAWVTGGGRAELDVLPSYGRDGHTIADNRSGWRVWGKTVEAFLKRNSSGSDSVPVASVHNGHKSTLGAVEAHAAEGPTALER